jgi:purine-binding chemotaxis protein CheW
VSFLSICGTNLRKEGPRIKTPGLAVFSIDEHRYALPTEDVETITRAAALTPLPKAPDIVLGILDLHGEVIPVVNIRRRFRLPERDIRPEDLFIVARAGSLKVALVVDEAHGVIEPEKDPVPPENVMAGLDYVAGVTRTEDGLVLIHDLDTFLSLEEENSLSQALEQGHE